jgi:ATP-binding cassette subfamily B protein
LARVGLSVLREYFLMQQTKDFNNRINNDFFNNLLQLPKPFFDTRKIGELVARLNDTQRIQRVIKQLASQMVIDVLVVIISMGFLFAYHWRVGLITLVSLPIYYLIIYRVNKKIINAQKEVMQGYALSESHYINTMQGIATIKNQNKQTVFEKINQTIFGFFQEKIFDLGKLNMHLSWQSGLAGVFFLMIILVYCSLDVINKKMPLGELMAVLGIAGGILPAIANLALISIPINEAKIAFERMFEFASMKKEVQEGETIDIIESIAVNQLSFRFAGRKPLFENVNINLSKNKIVALVGESGSGKSTIGQILQRFYGFEEGQIIVNKQLAMQEVNLNSFRQKIGVIPQDITIFNGNVVDNLLLGDERIDDLIKFLNDFGFMTFFSQFPQGLNTILGEEGINLSGGQRQLIALARILFRQPDFLILDESTSAMDRQTEKFCMQLLKNYKKNAIIFFISHRLHSLKNFADEIYILENQTISVFGSHEDLMKSSNFYSDFWLSI